MSESEERKSSSGMDEAEASLKLLKIVRELAVELHPHGRGPSLGLDSSLERDAGIDSLGRTELALRIERAFDVGLPERTMSTAETPRELLDVLMTAGPAVRRVSRERRPVAAESEGPVPESAGTLPEVLGFHARTQADRPYIYLLGPEGQEETLTYGALEREAQRVAAGLLSQGLQPGQAAALMLPTGREFFCGFFGILLAGGVPVPIYPPARPSQIEEHLRRQAGILSSARVAALVTVSEALLLGRLVRSRVDTLHAVVTVRDLIDTGGEYIRPKLQGRDTALLQYTSGSTGDPKGVVLAHDNLLANIRAMGQVVRPRPSEVFVSWLPLYHDMGLIGAWLGSLYYGRPFVVMSPLTFLSRPDRWLWAIHTYRGTLSAAPNFAYELCLKKIQDRDVEGLDLGSWRLALSGAEPVSPETVLQFSRRFERYGFRPEALMPVYGLAESAVGLTFPPLGRAPLIDVIERETFMRTGRAVPARREDRHAQSFVSCGRPLPGHEVRVVDDRGHEVGEREEGRLQFKGPSATSGYFRNPKATARLFQGEWLDSGDLAYVAGGEVYLTGRAKDVIIRAGRNIYPQELETAVGGLDGVREGCVAVFGSLDPASQTERLVVLAETGLSEAGALEKLRERIHQVTLDLLGLAPDNVALVPPRTVLKTSSGKIRRAASRALYEEGRLGRTQRAVWWQFFRLALAGTLPQLRRWLRGAGNSVYAAYVYVLFALLAPLVWTASVSLPRLGWRWGFLRAAGRLLIRLSGTPLTVQGLERLPADGAYVLASNHASYLDSLVLAAVLPGPLSFVAKRELEDSRILRPFLRRIGTSFVERFDPQRGAEDTEKVLEAVRQGRTAMFFPEGTCGRVPGLLPFRMGAFVVAAQGGVPVVPVALHGTRSMLRPGQWFLRRGAVRVTVGAPVKPEGSDWSSAVKLRDLVRAQILGRCGEPDLADGG